MINNHCKGGTMKSKATKRKAKKRVSRKKRRKNSRKHNSHHQTVNLQGVMRLKFPPLMKVYENFWDKRKKSKKIICRCRSESC